MAEEGRQWDFEEVLPLDCWRSEDSLLMDLQVIKVAVDTVMGGRYLGSHEGAMGNHEVPGRRASHCEDGVLMESSQ